MQKITIDGCIRDALDSIDRAKKNLRPELRLVEDGIVISVLNGIALVRGLPGVGYEELVRMGGSVYGIAFDINQDCVGVVLLGDYSRLQSGDRAERTWRVMDVPAGRELVGRVIDPLGRSLDGKGAPSCAQRLPIERPAAPIMARGAVAVPLQSGLKVIDALVPVGRGQRELILGDRQTGKTAIALSAIINQRGTDVICIYCAIGQRASSVAKVIAQLRENHALEHTVVVVSEGNDAPGLQYIAPYAATSIGEYFMEQGRDVLIVYDDLTRHAWAYRELSLLLKRPPGREAYPGDIFYIHSRLLERSTQLGKEQGGGSLTALPVIETEAENISAYIPTNLISITDGQIYLSPILFELGILPAVDIGKSVSRVGGKAQLSAYRSVTGNLKLAYAQFEELENFARFGTRLDEQSRKVLAHGERIRECLRQDETEVLSVEEQLLVLMALTGHQLEAIALERIREALAALYALAGEIPVAIRSKILGGGTLGEDDRATLLHMTQSSLAAFRTPV